MCAYQTIATNDGVVEDGAVNPNQAAVTDGAAVQHSEVADGDVAAYSKRCTRIGMQHCAILNVAVAAYGDGFVVAAQHGVKPDADVVLQDDGADDAGIGRDEMMLSVQLWGALF